MVWKQRTPRLFALLADLAPQLRELEHWYPTQAPASPASALPPELGRLSQLTSLTLHFGHTSVTTAQVNVMVQGLPLLRHLHLEADTGRALRGGFQRRRQSASPPAAAGSGISASDVWLSGQCRPSLGA